MKKLLIAMSMFLALSTASFAQTKPAQKMVKKDSTTKTTTTKTTTGPLKKDGTPDKRYKANETTTTGPVKKDGTPDKRYKENKKP